MQKLSIIIVTYNSADDIGHCLESIDQCLAELQPQVVVVDNASADATVTTVKKTMPSATVIEQENGGFAAGVNRGLAEVTGQYILLLNPDAVLVPGSVEQLLAYADAQPQAGIIGGRLVGEDKQPQASFGNFPTTLTEFFHTVQLHRLLPVGRYVPHNRLTRRWYRTQQVDWVGFGYALLRRTMVHQLGELDERFFMYMEDIDYCKRAQQAGWQVVYLANAPVIHRLQASWGGALDRAKRQEETSLRKYFTKHRQAGWALTPLLAIQRLLRRFKR